MRFTYAAGAKPVPGYTIERGLGRGGFGEVYFAVSDAGKEVALKLVQRHLEIELRGVGHCLNLKHPNLVAIFDLLKTDNDDNWIVMEYVAGESLAQTLDRYPQGMPEPMALAWMAGICDGVAYLHDCGLVHRDLTPSNLFVEHGVVKIGDYGLSKFISASRRSGQTENVGTVHYMAPEMSQGRYGKEVDQYALGIILVEMLTGRPPFDGESAGEILMKHLTAQPDLTGLAEPYASIAARLLDKDPLRRYPSITGFHSALPELGANRASAILRGDSGAAAASYSPTARTVTYVAASGRKDADRSPTPAEEAEMRFDKSAVIEMLIEQDWMVEDIERILLALRASPQKDASGMLKALEILLEQSYDADGIERLLCALGKHTEGDVNGALEALELLAENSWEAEEIERVVHALAKHPEFNANGAHKALELLVENSWEAEGIERVLSALGKHAVHQGKGLLKALELLVENSWEAEGIERVLSTLGKYPQHDWKSKLKALEVLVENGWEAEDIERILNAVGEGPEQQLQSKVRALESLIEDGTDVEEVEQALLSVGRRGA